MKNWTYLKEQDCCVFHSISTLLKIFAGDLSYKIDLNNLFPEIFQSSPMKICKDLKMRKFFETDKSFDDPLTRASESLIKLLGLHALASRKSKTENLTLNREEFRSTIFVNSLTREAEKWFGTNFQAQQFNQFLEKLHRDLFEFRQSNNFSHMALNTVKSWLSSFFLEGKDYPNFLIAKKDFFINAASKYFTDIEILEKYVAEEAVKENNPFINFLISEGNPGRKIENLIIVNTLEDHVHAEMRLLHSLSRVC